MNIGRERLRGAGARERAGAWRISGALGLVLGITLLVVAGVGLPSAHAAASGASTCYASDSDTNVTLGGDLLGSLGNLTTALTFGTTETLYTTVSDATGLCPAHDYLNVDLLGAPLYVDPPFVARFW